MKTLLIVAGLLLSAASLAVGSTLTDLGIASSNVLTGPVPTCNPKATSCQ